MAARAGFSKKTVTRCLTTRYKTWHIDQSREIFWENRFDDAEIEIFDNYSRSSLGIHGPNPVGQRVENFENQQTDRCRNLAVRESLIQSNNLFLLFTIIIKPQAFSSHCHVLNKDLRWTDTDTTSEIGHGQRVQYACTLISYKDSFNF